MRIGRAIAPPRHRGDGLIGIVPRVRSYHFLMTIFQGKSVLITGASSGIGRGVALRLAGLGAQIGLVARNQDALELVRKEIAAAGGTAVVLPADVTDAEQVRASVEGMIAQFGQLDILLASAGLSLRAYFESCQLEALERVMRVNFFGALYATHFALPHVKKAKGSLVAVSSLTGKRGIPSYAIYGASKFAIQGLYEALELELRPDGVHVGVVSPAFVDTPLRANVLGPDGQPWANPPAPPFRVWPVEKCVDRIIRLLVKRKRQTLMPWFAGPLLTFDELLGRVLGDRILMRRFPP
ncbi:MAG: SDR family oxidoreductase [Planctomycetes bacterium]|nr:SDR family oxidoreductase [Planctomycetota bacterium]